MTIIVVEEQRLVRVAEKRRWGGLTLEKRLPTLSVDTVIRFRSAADRADFSKDLTQAVTTLAARYHDAAAPGGRPHRLVIVAYPLLHKSHLKEPS